MVEINMNFWTFEKQLHQNPSYCPQSAWADFGGS